MRLVVGLGNPGMEYNNTRHNIGFMFLDRVCGSNFKANNKFEAMEYETNINGEKVLFIKPLTYMNLSGEAVIKYVKFYKIDISNILVIQDDLDMEIGSYKLMYNHGDGGHNGIKNIVAKLDSKSFLRLKIGISKPNSSDVVDYVLGKFSHDDIDKINMVFNALNGFLNDYISLSRDQFMEKYNSKDKKLNSKDD